MAFNIPRNQTIAEALGQAVQNALPGFVQGGREFRANQLANQQFQQSLAGLTGGQQDFQPQASAFGGLPESLGLPQPQIPPGQQQFDQFSGITDPAARQAVLGGLLQRQFGDPFGAEAARTDLLRAQTGQVGQIAPQSPEDIAATEALTAQRIAQTEQIGEPTPISPEESALKKAQTQKLIKETAAINPSTLTMDEQRKAELIAAGLSPKEISKIESDLIKSQISKNQAESNRLLRESKGVLTPQEKTAQSNKFRTEFNALSKDFIKSRDAFSRVEASAADPSAAGDLALIFNFMKVLDPGSVVRESEFANAAASGAFGERVKAAGGKILRGERLSTVMRADFLNRAKRLFKAQQGNQDKLIKRYTSLSKRFGVSPEDVVTEVSGDQATAPPQQTFTPEQIAAELKRRGQ